jgi:hypothetical protein
MLQQSTGVYNVSIKVVIQNISTDHSVRVVEVELLTGPDSESIEDDSTAERNFIIAPGESLTAIIHEHVSLIVEQIE